MKVRIGNHILGSNSGARLRFMDWILIIGLTLAPMTSLRIGKIGPAEALCALWSVRFVFKSRFRMTDIFRFFVGFMGCMLFGTAVGFLTARNELRISGLFTWLYLAGIAVLMYDGLSRNDSAYNEKLLNTFAAAALLWQLFLYIYSITVSKTLLGATLWYHGVRYAGGGTNPHQVAVLLCGVFPIFIRNVIRRKAVVFNIAFAAAAVFLLLKTKSSTGVLALAVCIAFFALLRIANIGSKRKRIQMLFITLLLIILAVLFLYKTVYNYLKEWIEEDSNGIGRIYIFSSFGNTFWKDPIFGLGPGVHGINGLIEFHNTYLEILAATGLEGMAFFEIYTVRIVKSLWKADWTLVPIIASMYAYGLASFAIRRLAYWGIVVIATALAAGINREKEMYPAGERDLLYSRE